MKKIVAVFLLLCMMSCLLPLQAHANSPGPNLDGTYETQPGWVVFVIVLYLIVMAFTCFVEWLVCIPFKLHYMYSKTIIVTNVITQVIMHFLEWLLLAVAPARGLDLIAWYILIITVLEIAVFVSEYLIYRKKILYLSRWTCLFYVLSANAASAFGGIILLMLIL